MIEDIELSTEVQVQDDALEAATQRIRAERLKVDAQNRELQALIEREEKLAAHLQQVLDAYQIERQSLDAEKSRVLSAAAS